jgi:2-haloacid dehalogenase
VATARACARGRSDKIAKAIIFDIGRVLFHWDLRHLFAKLIADPAELDWFLTHVITPEWHFQHDAGRDLDSMLAERIAEFPAHADLIRAYRHRFNETIPGLVEELHAAGVPLYIISNFGDEFWEGFHPTQPIFDRFQGIIISGKERLVKPDPAIFELALKRFALNPAHTLFIDDVPANVAGAESVGITGHPFRDVAGVRGWLGDRRTLA